MDKELKATLTAILACDNSAADLAATRHLHPELYAKVMASITKLAAMHAGQSWTMGDPTDDSCGVCPICHKTDGYRNVGRDHWFFCADHKVRWLFGSNMFSSYRHENEQQWRANRELLSDFAVVEPYSAPREPGPVDDDDDDLPF